MGALSGIEEDVPFDDGAADRLITVCDGAASVITGQVASRRSWQATAAKDFKGHFADLFRTQPDHRAQRRHRAGRRVAPGRHRRAPPEGGGAQGAAAPRGRAAVEEGARRPQHAREGLGQRLRRGRAPGRARPPSRSTSALPLPRPATGRRPPPAPAAAAGGGTSSARPEDLRTFAHRLARAPTTPCARSPRPCARRTPTSSRGAAGAP